MKHFIFIIFAAIALCGCAPEDGGGDPPVVKEQYIEIDGGEYELRSAKYSDGFYEVIGEDCICLHIELLMDGENTGAGMTVEMSKELIGTQIAILPSDTFWFFHVGTGRKRLSLESTYPPEKFENAKGWFTVDYGENEDDIVFEWDITDGSGSRTLTKGYIASAFERISM